MKRIYSKKKIAQSDGYDQLIELDREPQGGIPAGMAIMVEGEGYAGSRGDLHGPFSSYADAENWIATDVGERGILDDDQPDAMDRYWVVMGPESLIDVDVRGSSGGHGSPGGDVHVASNRKVIIEAKKGKKSPAWQRSEGKSDKGGLNEKGRKSYEKANPGSDLKPPVTESKPTGKRKKRQDSYCARSKGQMEDHNINCRKTPDKPICKSRRRWNC